MRSPIFKFAQKYEITNEKLLAQQGKITLILTALCALIYLAQQLGFEDDIMYLMHYPAYEEQDSEVWRYISHTLVHLSNLHILFNLSWFLFSVE